MEAKRLLQAFRAVLRSLFVVETDENQLASVDHEDVSQRGSWIKKFQEPITRRHRQWAVRPDQPPVPQAQPAHPAPAGGPSSLPGVNREPVPLARSPGPAGNADQRRAGGLAAGSTVIWTAQRLAAQGLKSVWSLEPFPVAPKRDRARLCTSAPAMPAGPRGLRVSIYKIL